MNSIGGDDPVWYTRDVVKARWSRLRRASPDLVLGAVRVWGVGVVAALGQFMVDTPGGWLGGVQQGTFAGLVYAFAMLTLTGACGLGALLGWKRWRGWFALGTLVGATFFFPALVTDTVVAGAISAWMVGSVSRTMFSEKRGGSHQRLSARDGSARPIAIHLLSLSLFLSLLIVGFELTDAPAGIYVCLGLAAAAIAVCFAALEMDRPLRGWIVISGILTIASAIFSESLVPVVGALGVTQLGLLALCIAHEPLAAELIWQFMERPGLLVVVTFGGIALLGALVLSFPATAETAPITPLDALFTAMSATCVTGLIVVDTPSAFSLLGEVVVLALFQIGGLGIMVLSTFGTVILGGRLSLRGERALEEVLDISSPAHAYRLVRFIVIATLTIEAAGAIALTWCYVRHGFDLSEAAWRGVFQAVSAFCNAGFSLQTDSIVMFQADALALGVHAILIVLGGLGFAVVSWIWSRVILRSRSRPPVQVRVVLHVSLILIAAGSLAYGALEWNASLGQLSIPHKITNAIFQSVSTRTAGFNSVDFLALRNPTMLMMIGLMFIGAAPGGTGGGIKITTLSVLIASIPRVLGGQQGAVLYGRSIPLDTLQRASTITLVAGMTAFVTLFALLLSEKAAFVSLAFEAVSALGTVGLSVGATGELTAMGKWALIATMFAGRVGPLTLALALGRRTRAGIRYPETRIMVG